MARSIVALTTLVLAACVGAPPPPPSDGGSGSSAPTMTGPGLPDTGDAPTASGGVDDDDDVPMPDDDDSGSSGTTGGPPPTTGEPPPTTGDPSTTTTTGQPPTGDPYSECDAEDECLWPGSECIDLGTEYVCAPPCQGDDDCPSQVDGDSVSPVCAESRDGFRMCVLPCMANSDCVVPMECILDATEIFDFPICAWD